MSYSDHSTTEEDEIMEYISQEGYSCAMCNQFPKRKLMYPCVGGHNLCEKCKITCGRKCFCGLLFNQSPIYLEDLLFKFMRPDSAQITDIMFKKKSSSKSSSRSTPNEESADTLFETVPQTSQSNYNQDSARHSDSSGTMQERHSPKYINLIKDVVIKEEHPVTRFNKIQTTTSNVHTSRRPIQCPNAECEKVIALSSLVLHFSFDHPKIVQKNIYFGETKMIPLNIKDIQYGKGNCIALMLLNNKGNHTPLSSSSPTQDFAFPILAARIRCQTHYVPEQTHFLTPRNEKKVNTHFDMIIVWLTGAVENDNVSCSLEFCNPSKGLSIAYSGQIVSLREDNDPYSIFSRSDCLIMNSTAIEKNQKEEKDDDRCFCNLKICLTKVAENLNLF